MPTRRSFLRLAGTAALAAVGLGLYAVGVEPMLRRVKRYALTPPGWPEGLSLRIVALADIHAAYPWMSVDRIAEIVEEANALEPDVIVLLGDYECSMRFQLGTVPRDDWARPLAGLRAPLGVYSVLGNHDWWDDEAAQAARSGPTQARLALERAGVPVLENDVVRVEKGGRPFWIAGLADQWALLPTPGSGRRRITGLDDLPGTLARVTDDAPVILLAHEPDIFPDVPDRVALTLSGHTHGGQVRFLGYSPVVPSRYGNRYAYGHIEEDGRNLIVSGGLGFSILPVRFGVRPEIVQIDLFPE